MAVARTRLTLEQFLALPEEKPALEFADGMVSPKVSPQGKHSVLQAELLQRLNQAGQRRKLALAFPELRTTFGGASRVPDIAVYRRDRIPTDDAGQVANAFQEPPDIAIEVASPDQSVTALVRRCLWYIANGVQIALLVDPVDQSILTFRPHQAPQALRGPETIDVSEILPDFKLTVDELFASLRIR